MTPALAARNEIMLEHLGMVRAIARSVHRQFPLSSLEDLQQVGAIALLEAVERNDGRNLVAYAAARVRGAMLSSVCSRRARPQVLQLMGEPADWRTTESRYELREALESLPEMEREILLRRMEGYTRAELARSIQMSVDQVERYEERAVERLREREKVRRVA